MHQLCKCLFPSFLELNCSNTLGHQYKVNHGAWVFTGWKTDLVQFQWVQLDSCVSSSMNSDYGNIEFHCFKWSSVLLSVVLIRYDAMHDTVSYFSLLYFISLSNLFQKLSWKFCRWMWWERMSRNYFFTW